MLHAQAQLQDFTGTLLTDGYAAYTKTVEQLNQYEQQIVHAACKALIPTIIWWMYYNAWHYIRPGT